MSALDPALLSGGTADQVAREIALLATNAQALGDELRADALVTARVLPPNGISDVVEILGRRVAADLPPDLRPGDVIVVRVQGFDGDRIVLKNLGAASAETPLAAEAANGETAASSASSTPLPRAAVPLANSAPSTAEIRSAIASASRTAPSAARTPYPPQAAPGPAPAPAPSSAVFVAASIRTSSGGETTAPSDALEPEAGARSGAVRRPPEPLARAAASAAAAPLRPQAPLQASASGGAMRARGFDGGGAQMAAVRAAVLTTPKAPVPQAAPSPQAPAAAQPAASAASDIRDPRRFLTAVGIDAPSETIATVRNALAHPERLPEALRALDESLRPADADPRVATLRALAPFVGRLEPRLPTLGTQISAYVSHVLDGREPKLATLLTALAGGSGPAAHAQAAGARMSLEHDLKSLILALVADPPSAAAESFPAAAAATLGAMTSAQLAAGAAQTPNAVSLAIPLSFGSSATTAHVRIDRDPARAQISADDFHIGFVLSTERLGTVAIDLRTVERAVAVRVNAQSEPAAGVFGVSLDRLAARLERLRYRVVSLEAGIAPAARADAPPHGEPVHTGRGLVDVQI